MRISNAAAVALLCVPLTLGACGTIPKYTQNNLPTLAEKIDLAKYPQEELYRLMVNKKLENVECGQKEGVKYCGLHVKGKDPIGHAKAYTVVAREGEFGRELILTVYDAMQASQGRPMNVMIYKTYRDRIFPDTLPVYLNTKYPKERVEKLQKEPWKGLKTGDTKNEVKTLIPKGFEKKALGYMTAGVKNAITDLSDQAYFKNPDME